MHAHIYTLVRARTIAMITLPQRFVHVNEHYLQIERNRQVDERIRHMTRILEPSLVA